MAFSVSGIGSGLDVNSIVTQLMDLERLPLNALQTRKTEFDNQLSAYGQLKSQLSTFSASMEELSSLDKFEVYSATSSNEDVFTVSTDSEASKGTYDIKVNRLASAMSVRSHQFSPTTQMGEGSLDISVGGNAFTVTIGAGAGTVTDIRDAINGANDNTGVTASVINDGFFDYLTITSDETGLASTITVSATVTNPGPIYDLSELNSANLVTMVDANNASITVGQTNGIIVSSESNTIDSAISGVTLNLKQVTTDFETLTIERNTEAVATTVEQFINSFNNLQNKIESLRDGELSGDSALLSIQGGIRNVMNTSPVGLVTSMVTLAEVGIKTEKDGTLSLNRTILDKVLSSDFSGISELFAHDDQGFAFRMKAATDQMLDFDGIIDSRQDGLNGRISTLDDEILKMEYRLELKETSLRRKYSTLDTLLASLQSSGDYLTQQLASLPGSK